MAPVPLGDTGAIHCFPTGSIISLRVRFDISPAGFGNF